MNKIMNFEYRKLGIISDLTCNETKQFFEINSELRFFNASYNWLMLSENFSSSIDLLSTQNINLDAEITLAIPTGIKSFDLFDIYNPGFLNGGELIVTPKGTSFNITLPKSKFESRSDMRGIIINAGIVTTAVKKNQTFVEYLESDENTLIDIQHRHDYRIHKLIAQKHNFTYFLHRAALWGYNLNGTFSGLLGMHQTRQIEVGISPLMRNLERMAMVEFATAYTWITKPTIVFRHPKNTLRNPFLQPLSLWVWNCIFLCMFFVTILITIAIRFSQSIKKRFEFLRAFMTVHGVMCQQGFVETFWMPSVRVVLLIFILFSQIIYQFYSSFIVGSLLTDPPKTIDTIKKLIDSDLEVGFEDVTYTLDLIRNSPDPLAHKMFEKASCGKRHKELYAIDEGLELLKKGGFAYHFDTSYGYRTVQESFSEHEICELQELFLFQVRPLSTTFAKRSPFKELIRLEILRFYEHGILKYYDRKFGSKKPACVKSVTKIKAIDIEDTNWVFILLSSAILLSFFVVLLENLHYKLFYRKIFKKKSKKQRSINKH